MMTMAKQSKPTPTPEEARAPAKVERLGDPLQLKARAAQLSYAGGADLLAPGQDVRGVAEAGLAGSGGALPHLDAIQQSFGAHDVRGVRAHTDAPAVQATSALGAHGYARGESVAFGSSPSLHTAAHEAAHVVQQRSGDVSVPGGVGQAGDRYERNADAVADAVVQGKSAEGLLGAPVPETSSRAVQLDEDADYQAELTKYRNLIAIRAHVVRYNYYTMYERLKKAGETKQAKAFYEVAILHLNKVVRAEEVAKSFYDDGEWDEDGLKEYILSLGKAADAAVRLVARPFNDKNATQWASDTAAAFGKMAPLVKHTLKRLKFPWTTYVVLLMKSPSKFVASYRRIVSSYLHKIDSRSHVPRSTRRGNGGTWQNMK